MAKKKSKIEKVMHEFKEGKLHSGSKKGPKVKSREQAIAIAISEEEDDDDKKPKSSAAKRLGMMRKKRGY